ncbi:hypothetical protein KIN20_007202 [Parelaphostrongylus tenuis]|uniref:Uncharacterized protein n=1 Tax=Parelaphostrongylus tenuis TaxID=148309 RepID=A0AAD5M2Z4_PARTN|nr:hypothetical protein KIN20_007202 [Parelaphostrongylus tenuis]
MLVYKLHINHWGDRYKVSRNMKMYPTHIRIARMASAHGDQLWFHKMFERYWFYLKFSLPK